MPTGVILLELGAIILGLAIFVVSTVMWVRDTRRERAFHAAVHTAVSRGRAGRSPGGARSFAVGASRR